MKALLNVSTNRAWCSDDFEELPVTSYPGFTLSYWVPNTEERLLIAAGLPVRVCLFGNDMVMHKLDVGE